VIAARFGRAPGAEWVEIGGREAIAAMTQPSSATPRCSASTIMRACRGCTG